MEKLIKFNHDSTIQHFNSQTSRMAETEGIDLNYYKRKAKDLALIEKSERPNMDDLILVGEGSSRSDARSKIIINSKTIVTKKVSSKGKKK